MATRWARFARGWVIAGFSTFVAALSHTLGGGGVPTMLAVVLSLAFAGLVCVGLSGRTLSLWRVSVSVVVSQLIFHGLFSFGGPGGALVVSGQSAPGVHQHSAIELLAGTGGTSAMIGHGAHTVDAMWVAHAVAAVVTIVALRHGEAAFWSLFSSVRLGIRSMFGALAGVFAGAALPVIRRVTASTARVFTPRDLTIVLSSMRHRGPPALRFS